MMDVVERPMVVLLVVVGWTRSGLTLTGEALDNIS